MRFLVSLTLLAICIGLAVAGPIPHKHHGHSAGHGEATSYAVVTKHKSYHGDGHLHYNKAHQVHHEDNHGNADHGKATSYTVVTKHESTHGDVHHKNNHGHGHDEYKVEDHGNNGHDDGHHGHHDHGEANSYSVVTKHESNHGDGHFHDNKGNHVHHKDNHGHGVDGHKVETHGNNGHDDGHHDNHADYHGHAKYEFGYGVKDTKTGDIKDQWESRDVDKVKGTYSLKESDGTTRVVKYSSDKKSGFEAVVHKIGHAHHDHQAYGHKR